MGNRVSSRPTSSMTSHRPQQHCTSSAFQRCVDADLASTVRRHLPPDLSQPWPSGRIPIVYSEKYNIGFFGIEKLHPFDSKKYQHVVSLLQTAGVLAPADLACPHEASLQALSDVHTVEYLKKLETSPMKVAMVTQLPPLAFLPSSLLCQKVLKPMRLMAGGSVLAGALALECGWALNLGGGMHHSHYHDAGGWCVYDDITFIIRSIARAAQGRLDSVMIVDVDVHQGNGHERSKMHFLGSSLTTNSGQHIQMPNTVIVDLYRKDVYPLDHPAKAGIDVDVPLPGGISDEEYLGALEKALEEAFQRCSPPPKLLIYNAGTDILTGDPLGGMDVSAEGVVKRDEMVFAAALERKVPVVMLTSGGYSKASAPCIAKSVENLVNKFGIGVVQ